jgi:hypothetical protein
MELIKDLSKFREASTLFLGDAKAVWNKATLLSLSAIHYYVDKKDTVLIAELQNTFIEAGGSFSACFESAVYATTNVKFRQDEEDLTAAVTCKTKGNMPDGFGAILSTIEQEGIRRYEKKLKSKSRAAAWNNDGQSKPRVTKSTAADVTSLKQTELGTALIAAAEAGSKLEGDAAVKAQELTDKFNAQMAALAAGETLPVEDVTTAPLLPDSELDCQLREALEVLAAIHAFGDQKNRRNTSAREAVKGMIEHLKHDADQSLEAYKKIVEATAAAAQAAA